MKTENYFLSKVELVGKIDQHRPSEKNLLSFLCLTLKVNNIFFYFFDKVS